jgi:putative alpha-1,2-mannosidase
MKIVDRCLHGKKFTIKAENFHQNNFYVKSVSLNGKKLDRIYIMHDEIMNGGELVFEMSDEPMK